MAIIVNHQGPETELKKRITAELREKNLQKSQQSGDPLGPEYDAENSNYTKDLKQTSSLAWAWALIFFAVIGIVIAVIVITLNN